MSGDLDTAGAESATRNCRHGKVWVYRSLLRGPATILRDALLLQIWIVLLLRAAWKARSVPVSTGRGKTIVSLQAGQILTGVPSLAEFTGQKPRTVRDKISALVRMECITYAPGPHFSIITIINWAAYQTPQKRVEANREATPRPNSARQHREATDATKCTTVAVLSNCADIEPRGNSASDNREAVPPHHRDIQEGTNKKVLTNTSRALRFDAPDRELAVHIWTKLQAMQPTRKAPSLDAWANSIRLARETDGRSLEDLRDVFDRAHADQFWQKNILCPDKLRAKFDDLDLKLRKGTNARPRLFAGQEFVG